MQDPLSGQMKDTPVGHADLPRLEASDRPDPVLVVGMHNSGTSIVAEVLHRGGLFLGANMGHYESHFFSVFVNDLLVLGGGANWSRLPILSVDEVLAFRETVGPFVRRHWMADYLQWGYDGVSPWGIKDPRLCVLLPLYLEIFPRAKVVHVRRDPDDVAASLCRRHKRGVGTLDDFDHWRGLTEEYVRRVLDCAPRLGDGRYHELAYEAFCADSAPATEALFGFVGLPFTPDTEALLSNVETSRVGSYRRRQRRGARLWRLFGG